MGGSEESLAPVVVVVSKLFNLLKTEVNDTERVLSKVNRKVLNRIASQRSGGFAFNRGGILGVESQTLLALFALV